MNLIKKKCVICGCFFMCKKHGNYREPITCSLVCRKKRRIAQTRLWRLSKKQTPKMKHCVICGKNFKTSFTAIVCSPECKRKRRKKIVNQWRLSNREYINQRKKTYHLANLEHCRKIAREYYHAHKNSSKRHIYYINNKEKILETIKKYRNSLRGKEKWKSWYLKNRDKIKERNKQYAIKNRDQIKKRAQKFYYKHRERLISEAQRRRWRNIEKIKERNEMKRIALEICMNLGLENAIREKINYEA